MSTTPIKLSVGGQEIKVDSRGSPEALRSGLQQAFKQIADNFRYFVDELDGFLPEDLAWALEPTFEKSQLWCPVDTGETKASGYLIKQGYSGGARVEIGYGRGGNPAKAIYVHEMPYLHAAPTRSKFLQAAVEDDFYVIQQRVVSRISYRANAGGG